MTSPLRQGFGLVHPFAMFRVAEGYQVQDAELLERLFDGKPKRVPRQSVGLTRRQEQRDVPVVIEPLVQWLADAVVAEVTRRSDPDPWVSAEDSPLGKRRTQQLCRNRTLNTARKEGRRWFVRRSELDAYIESQSGGAGRSSDDYVSVLAEVGLEPKGAVR